MGQYNIAYFILYFGDFCYNNDHFNLSRHTPQIISASIVSIVIMKIYIIYIIYNE